MTPFEYEPVIGLEVHAQLLTQSKIFCGCSTRFGAPPNTHTCPVCLGYPGALPVLNQGAVEMALKAAMAFDCTINERSVFARKNYFYPDLPKGYQISQYDQPLAEKGRLTLTAEMAGAPEKPPETCRQAFRIMRIHLEEDAGKSIHAAAAETVVNLNRSGVPLIEIVTEPDFRSSQQACDFVEWLRLTLLYLKICDGNMEEGSLRCDANVSVRKVGTTEFGTKLEIKNLNSFRFLKRALDYEIARQIRVLQSGGEVLQETRLWDEESGRTVAMRTKEEAHDYRYFPEPDLLPLKVCPEWVERLRSELTELPEPRRGRLMSQYGLQEESALQLVQNLGFADYFEKAVDSYSQPVAVFNWMMGELIRHLKLSNLEIADCPVAPEGLASLIRLVDERIISGKMGKEVLSRMVQTGKDAETIVAEEGLRQISDSDKLAALADEVLQSYPDKVEAYRGGKEGLIGFFVGQIMKKTQGQANPKLVNQILREKLKPSS